MGQGEKHSQNERDVYQTELGDLDHKKLMCVIECL